MMRFFKGKKIQYFSYIFIFFISACNNIGSYQYKPVNKITFDITIKNLKSMPKLNAKFLYCYLVVKNNSDSHHYFDLNNIQAKLNGVISESVYYDSLASVMPEKIELPIGESEYRIYFVYPDTISDSKAYKFELINFGLS